MVTAKEKTAKVILDTAKLNGLRLEWQRRLPYQWEGTLGTGTASQPWSLKKE